MHPNLIIHVHVQCTLARTIIQPMHPNLIIHVHVHVQCTLARTIIQPMHPNLIIHEGCSLPIITQLLYMSSKSLSDSPPLSQSSLVAF